MRLTIVLGILFSAVPASAQLYWVPTPVVAPTVSYYVAPQLVAAPPATAPKFYVPSTSYYVPAATPTTSYYVPATVPLTTSYYLPATAPVTTSYYVPATTPVTTSHYVPAPSFYVPATVAPPQPTQKIERYYFHGNGKQTPTAQKASATGETIVREYYYYPAEEASVLKLEPTPKNSTEKGTTRTDVEKLDMPTAEEALKKRPTTDADGPAPTSVSAEPKDVLAEPAEKSPATP